MPSRLKYIRIKKNSDSNNYFKVIKYPPIPLSQNDIYVITTLGDRLDTLANTFYKDPSLWWVITKANPDKIRRDGLLIKPGIQIRIPSIIEKILIDFEKINKNK